MRVIREYMYGIVRGWMIKETEIFGARKIWKEMNGGRRVKGR